MSDMSEDSTVEPEYLGEVFDILDVNSRVLKKNHGRSPDWLVEYKNVKVAYDKAENDIIAEIEKFNEFSEQTKSNLVQLSKKFITITGQSPGEKKKLAKLKKQVDELQKLGDVSDKFREKVNRVQSVIEKSKKHPVDLGVVLKTIDRLDVLQEFVEKIAE